MPRNPRRGPLHTLTDSEARSVLNLMLQRHPSLAAEAEELALQVAARVEREAVATEVLDAVRGLGYGELNARAGPHSWGHVEPTEAAWELLDEAIAPFLLELRRLLSLELERAARAQCEGVLLGLHRLQREHGDHDVLGWAPDFIGEAAGTTLEAWLSRRDGPRELDEGFVSEEVPGWEGLVRAVRASLTGRP